jgi:hypothetical protein
MLHVIQADFSELAGGVQLEDDGLGIRAASAVYRDIYVLRNRIGGDVADRDLVRGGAESSSDLAVNALNINGSGCAGFGVAGIDRDDLRAQRIAESIISFFFYKINIANVLLLESSF